MRSERESTLSLEEDKDSWTPFSPILHHSPSVRCFLANILSSIVNLIFITARRSNQSILREISPECSLEGLMLKLKLQYFGHLM